MQINADIMEISLEVAQKKLKKQNFPYDQIYLGMYSVNSRSYHRDVFTSIFIVTSW